MRNLTIRTAGIVVRIAWCGKKLWEGFPDNYEELKVAGNFGYSGHEPPIPFECWNFAPSGEIDGFRYSFAQHLNNPPKQPVKILFWIVQGGVPENERKKFNMEGEKWIVGFMYKPEFLRKTLKIEEVDPDHSSELQKMGLKEIPFNVRCKIENAIRFYPEGGFIGEEDFKDIYSITTKGKKRGISVQQTFIYVDYVNTRRILEKAKEKHEKLLEKIKDEEKKREILKILDAINRVLKELKGSSMLKEYFASKGFLFQEHQISSFYTSLKTKGFVILAGLSGTGKTKMAQLFGELFWNVDYKKPALVGSVGPPKGAKESIKEFIENFRKNKDLFLWKASLDDDILNELKKYLPIKLYLKEKGSDKLVIAFTVENIFKYKDYKEKEFIEKRALNKSIIENTNLIFEVKDFDYVNIPYENIKFIDRNKFKGGELIEENINISKKKGLQNSFNLIFDFVYPVLFLSVRPDWKDSKTLLGYYNPILQRYELTPLFEFILKAIVDYKENNKNASPYFVVLDEMNLARVEYYFAEFLSVLESGRDEKGFTKEGIKIQIKGENLEAQDKKQKELFKLLERAGINVKTHIELKLPPNLYFIGTVNIDETTFMFSPKVLDRAFTIEFKEVDFENYKNILLSSSTDLSSQGIVKLEDFNKLFDDFTLDGNFLTLYADKEKIKEAESKNIIKFEKEDNEIIDLAVLMKVLPKFHGNRGKLEEPLWKVLYWSLKGTIEGNNFEIRKVWQKITNKQEEPDLREIAEFLKNFDETKFNFPYTARKVFEMLYKLYTDGYASYL